MSGLILISLTSLDEDTVMIGRKYGPPRVFYYGSGETKAYMTLSS
jgi:hypothetical protein